MSLVERARELKRRKLQPTEELSHRRWLLDRIYQDSINLLKQRGTRNYLQEFFSFKVNDPPHEPLVEVRISKKLGNYPVQLEVEVEALDESLVVEDAGEVKNSQRQFKAYLKRPSSGFHIREASFDDVKEYSELIDTVRSQLELSKLRFVN